MSRAGTKTITLDNEVHEKIKNIAERNNISLKGAVLYAMAVTFPDDFPELGIA
jgi:hypothetical protein